MGFELITLVVMGTACTGSCKYNYHTIMIKTAPLALGGSCLIRELLLLIYLNDFLSHNFILYILTNLVTEFFIS